VAVSIFGDLDLTGWQVEKNTIVDSSNDPVSQLQKIALFVKDSDREYVPTSLCFGFVCYLLSAVRCSLSATQ
jgi:hypothetical protein